MTAARGAKAKAKLVARHLPEDDVDVPGLDVTVRVRGLSREEVLSFESELTTTEVEVRMLALGFVDPEMTEAEVEAWRKGGTPAEVRAVAHKIEVLSGLRKETAKETWKEMESDPDAEFRALPGGEAGDDGGAPAG